MLARVTAALFVVSSLFPLTAGLLNISPPPHWLGIADVAVAVTLVAAALVLAMRHPASMERELAAGFKISRAVAAVIPVLLVLFFVARNHVNWQILVIGLAWRAWLLVFVAPSLAAALARSVSARAAKMP